MTHALIRAVTAAALLATAAGQLQAQTIVAQTRARLFSISLTVYDALPDDGIAPSVTFLDDVNAWRSYGYLGIYRQADQSDVLSKKVLEFQPDARPLLPAATVAATWPIEGAGAAGASGFYPTSSVKVLAQGQIFDGGLGYTAHAGLSSTATGERSPTFYNMVLGVGTGVILNAWGQAEAWLNTSGSVAGSSAEVYSTFSDMGPSGQYQPMQAVTRRDAVDVYLDAAMPEVTGATTPLAYVTSTRLLSIMYANDTDHAQIGRVRFAADSYAESAPLASVPEPSGFWLLSGGVPLIWAARRRARG